MAVLNEDQDEYKTWQFIPPCINNVGTVNYYNDHFRLPLDFGHVCLLCKRSVDTIEVVHFCTEHTSRCPLICNQCFKF